MYWKMQGQKSATCTICRHAISLSPLVPSRLSGEEQSSLILSAWESCSRQWRLSAEAEEPAEEAQWPVLRT